MRRFSPLDSGAQYLKGVGPRRAALLERLGIQTGRDLLYHTPRRYEDASTITPIRSVQTGMDVSIIGRVFSKGVLPTHKGLKIFQAVVRDATGSIECSWPGQPYLDRVIERGDLLLLSGPVKFFHGNQLYPREFTILESGGEQGSFAEGVVFPIYPATEGLTHKQIRGIIAENLEELLASIGADDPLPAELLRKADVPTLDQALRAVHQPENLGDAERGRRRLALEELFFLQLIHARSRHAATEARPGAAMTRKGDLVPRLLRALPYELTGAQRRVLAEIGADLASPRRMNRLLQGDVGSGKTVVALLAAARAIENGYQAAMMVPTEILAEQHARTVERTLGQLGVGTQLLVGRAPSAAKRAALGRVASGEAQFVVGTHALIQEGVEFSRLGLAIVDEQHRFGVRQRLALTNHGDNPDLLVMSATPIPRSLALTLYGDLDVSVLDERPPGRRPIRSVIRYPKDRESVYGFVREQVREGRQAYLVFPLVEESEALPLKAAAEEFEKLKTAVFSDLRVSLLHGQMPSDEKDLVMRAFAAGMTDVLVATTVIEVGVDVPNATVMVVEHAERFGLSQLHQLRGRVGRGADSSYCILVSDAGHAVERLRIFTRTEDGFRIAEEDLRLRGQGDLFGARQSGLAAFRWANLQTDLSLLTLARDEARRIVDTDPDLKAHEKLREAFEKSYAERKEMYERG